jgi:RNA polymerase sigma-70 factor (ECF subfamily)
MTASSRSDIEDLIARVRGGDQDSAAELVREYEPYVRRAVRIRLRDPRLRSALDTADICQSVMASFFARLALGQYDLSEPRRLAALLVTMARSKVATRARRAEVTRRDRQGQGMVAQAVHAVLDRQPEPSRLVAGRDLLEQFHRRLEPDERALSDRRADGWTWTEIAAEVGSTPEALRKKLARALDRVACALGLDDPVEF